MQLFILLPLCLLKSLKNRTFATKSEGKQQRLPTTNIKHSIMDEAIKQIGERLKGLREVLNIQAEEVAELCEISLDHYLKIESG